jgi:hypothetical protein
VQLLLDSEHPGQTPEPLWLDQFEGRIREVASRSVAHIKRGDWVNVRASNGESATGNSSVGADPVLRFLALIEPSAKSLPRAADAELPGGVVVPAGYQYAASATIDVIPPSAATRRRRRT